MSATQTRRKGHTNNGKANNKTNNKQATKTTTSSSSSSSSKTPTTSSNAPLLQDPKGGDQQQSKGGLGLFWVIVRLLTLLGKGLVAMAIFAVIFNLALVIINKTLLDGKLSQYINTPNWKELIEGLTKR